MKKERPFTPREDELDAILKGRQTMFARPIKPQPKGSDYWTLLDSAFYPNSLEATPSILHCPFGASGDLLWIKEKFAIECPYGPPEGCDNPDHVWPWYGEVAREMFTAPWRPAVTMPRWASKRELRVLKVRVAQVESISEIDAQKLGWAFQGHNPLWAYDPTTMNTAQRWFREVWDGVYAGRDLSVGANPWLWLVEFRYEQAQIAAA